ncbi:MAG: hypothetical protein ABFQ95_08495 [Pseudomonadota bacterium]
MKRFYLLSAILVAQVFCLIGTGDFSERPELGRDILGIVENSI